ncbi:hypothetical protein, partial [Enterobacter asburiae]|uniref:hypothetical protein n=1 Tax=Enterobacter asburiae TaxID=61645 RepID=UPI001C3F7D9D
MKTSIINGSEVSRLSVAIQLVLVLDIYSSLSLIWRYSYCLVFQGATSHGCGAEVFIFLRCIALQMK